MTLQRQPTLLLISTNPHFIYLIQRYGTRSGHRVIHVGTAARALESLQVEQPALLLLHLMEEPGAGCSTLHQLQTNSATSKIPIAVVSALADDAYRVAGAAHWLAQPVMYEDFLSVLASI